jgi:hypothetical protein
MRRRQHLFKFFGDRKYAESMLDGALAFRSLAYFRDYEDAQVRGDHDEGTSVFRPRRGLQVTNHTQRTRFTMPDAAFETNVKAAQILVCCTSKSMKPIHWREFKAVACVEICDVAEFCRRVETALPAHAKFPGKPGHEKLGQHVEYYREFEGPTPRWALPDVIATSKHLSYGWQDEFRLVYSLTDALAFENVQCRLVRGPSTRQSNPAEHVLEIVQAASLRDIAKLHERPSALLAAS